MGTKINGIKWEPVDSLMYVCQRSFQYINVSMYMFVYYSLRNWLEVAAGAG